MGSTGGATWTAQGANIDSDGTCSTLASSNFTTIDPLLYPLNDNGGPTLTHRLNPVSPARDAGDNAVIPADVTDLDNDTNIVEPLPFDQRGMGFDRVLDGGVDIGAFEVETACAVVPFNIPDGDVTALITAIDAANDELCYFGSDTITLAANGTYTLTVVNNTADGANGLPAITSDITIDANNATIERSVIGGTPDFRIFYISEFGALTVNDAIVQNGLANTGGVFGDDGGGFLNEGGMLTVNRSTITNNESARAGGGIFTNVDGSLEVSDTIVTDNAAGFSGGGIMDNFGCLNTHSRYNDCEQYSR